MEAGTRRGDAMATLHGSQPRSGSGIPQEWRLRDEGELKFFFWAGGGPILSSVSSFEAAAKREQPFWGQLPCAAHAAARRPSDQGQIRSGASSTLELLKCVFRFLFGRLIKVRFQGQRW